MIINYNAHKVFQWIIKGIVSLFNIGLLVCNILKKSAHIVAFTIKNAID